MDALRLRRRPKAVTLPEIRIALAAKNHQEIYQNRQGNNPWRPTAKQNSPKIESQGNCVSLAAGHQESFAWQSSCQEN